MATSCNLNQYIQLVERMFRTAQATALANFLNLHDSHVLNKNLITNNFIDYVVANCVAPLDELIITHLLCVKVNTFVYLLLINNFICSSSLV